jgi:hypothetical protein
LRGGQEMRRPQAPDGISCNYRKHTTGPAKASRLQNGALSVRGFSGTTGLFFPSRWLRAMANVSSRETTRTGCEQWWQD